MFKKIIGIAISCLIIAGGIGNGQVMAMNSTNKGKAPKLNSQIEKIKNEDYYKKRGGWEETANNISLISDEVLSSFANIKSMSELKELKKLNNNNKDRDIVLDYKLYRNMIENEYVVDLINITLDSAKKTKIEEWETNLDFLETNYDTIKALPDIEMEIIDRYIETYEEQREAQKISNKSLESTTAVSPLIANPSAVVSYIDNYWQNYNLASYPDWSINYDGDCANFVSQVLKKGGKPMIGTPGTDAAAQNPINWFSTGTAENIKNVSSSWRGANAFKNHWMSKVSYKKYTSTPYSANGNASIGDAVSLLDPNGVAIHTLVVYKVGYIGSTLEIILAAHTSNTKSALFSSKYNYFRGGAIIFRM